MTKRYGISYKMVYVMGILILCDATVGLSQWRTYSEAQYDSLRRRWSREDIHAVTEFLNSNDKSFAEKFFSKDTSSDLYGYDFRSIPIKDSIRLVGDLHNAHLEGAEIAYIDGSGKNLEGIQCTDATLHYANFEKAILRKASFAGCDLRMARLKHVNLDSAYLRYADLRQADLDSSSLTGAEIDWALLDSSSFRNADLTNSTLNHSVCLKGNFQGCNFANAQMVMTELWNADLQGANCYNVDFHRAYISNAKVRGADFFGAKFDTTSVSFTNFGEALVRYITWGSAVRKNRSYYIREEQLISEDTIEAKKELDEQIAEDAYRDLESIYRKEGRPAIADEFHFRLNNLITNSYPYWNPIRILRFVFLRLSYGYGTQPLYLALWSCGIVLLFTFIFVTITSTKSLSGIYIIETHEDGRKEETLLHYRGGLLFADCFYFSLLSFSTFGYGALQPKQWLEFFRKVPVEFKPIGWARIFVGIGAAFGIYTFALLVTSTFGSN